MDAGTESPTERQSQIYEAALACFGRYGYHQTTMDQVAAESGLSKGTLYWHFRSKQALFLALFRHLMDQLAERWEAMVRREPGGATAKLEASLAFFRQDVEPLLPVFTIMIETWALIREDAELAAQARLAFGRFQRGVEQIIAQGVAAGELNVASPDDVAFVLVTLITGIVVRMASGFWQRDWERVLDCVRQLVLGGLTPRSDYRA